MNKHILVDINELINLFKDRVSLLSLMMSDNQYDSVIINDQLTIANRELKKLEEMVK